MRMRQTFRGPGDSSEEGKGAKLCQASLQALASKVGEDTHILLLDSYWGDSGVGVPFLTTHESGGSSEKQSQHGGSRERNQS